MRMARRLNIRCKIHWRWSYQGVLTNLLFLIKSFILGCQWQGVSISLYAPMCSEITSSVLGIVSQGCATKRSHLRRFGHRGSVVRLCGTCNHKVVGSNPNGLIADFTMTRTSIVDKLLNHISWFLQFIIIDIKQMFVWERLAVVYLVFKSSFTNVTTILCLPYVT